MLDAEKKKNMLYNMILIREFENAVSECKDKGLIYGGAHCYNGEEAIAVGVCSALNMEDYIISNHRPHGHAIAKGVDPKKIMAEMFGKIDGTNSGKGGSMHIHGADVGLIASSGIVGSGIPVGCGAAFAAKYKNTSRVSCVFFGDGSANEGVLHESLNLASIWNLPVLFVLEDNGLAITANTRETSACNDYVKLASVYNIDGIHVNGQDVEEVFTKTFDALSFIRKESRPYFIQAHTIRFNEHAEGDFYKRMIPTGYRDYEKLGQEKVNQCPIKLYISRLKMDRLICDEEIAGIQYEVKRLITECIEYANESLDPDITQANTYVYKETKSYEN